MVSRHTSPTYTNGDRDPIIESNTMGIPKNSSPILDPKTNDVSTKSSPIAVVADGEVVVFDDNDDWKGDFLLSYNSFGYHATGYIRQLY
jgi:hypothetical protein